MAQGVVNIMREWLFGPILPIEQVRCANCEMLQEQLAFANYDRKMLLEHFIKAAMPQRTENEQVNTDELAPLRNTKFVPWRVRQQELEKNSRQRASILKPEPKPDAPRVVTQESIEKLEQELGIKGAEDGIPGEAV